MSIKIWTQITLTNLPALSLPELVLAMSFLDGGLGSPGITGDWLDGASVELLVVFHVSNTSRSSAVRFVSVEGTLFHDIGVVPKMYTLSG